MNNKIRVKEDEFKTRIIFYDITDKMKILIGDFVEYAETELFKNYMFSEEDSSWDGYDETESDEIKETNSKIIEVDEYFNKNSSVDTGGLEVNIVFTNGNQITINSTEWGSISKMNI